MIYRAPERTTPARGRRVTHELAALLVGMALLAAVILQLACAGAGGATGRWLCVNNARLASLRPPTATAQPTRPAGHSAVLKPIGAAPQAAPATPTAPYPGAPGDGIDPFANPTTLGLTATDEPPTDSGGYPATRRLPTVDSGGLPTPNPNAFSERRATMTAVVAEVLATASARAGREGGTVTPAATTPAALSSTTATQTPGPGTPSVTPGPTGTGSATATQTGYP